MRIAILGSTGQVGSAILKQLQDDYKQATLIACSRTKREGHFLFNPFMDNWSVLGEVDILINCIGIIEERAALSFEKAHLGTTELILKNRSEIGNPRVIQISANGADPTSSYAYFSSKGKADEALLAQANSFVIRPSVICTPGAAMVKQLRNARTLSYFFLNTMPFPKSNFGIKLQPVLDTDLAELVSELCVVDKADSLIYAVGKDIITVRELFKILNRYLIMIPVPKNGFDKLFYRIAPLLKKIITKTQYQLLSQDNIADAEPMERVLGRKVKGSVDFWKAEFK